MSGLSDVERLADAINQDPSIREELENLTEAEAEALLYDWDFWARPDQKLPEGDWDTWLIRSGRGWGKSRTGAESIKFWQRAGFTRFHLVARTEADYRDVMVDGESGLLSIYRPSERPTWEPSKRRVTWSNGAYALCFASKKPDSLRGPQCEKLWGDEPASWYYPRATYDNAVFGCRLGKHPQMVLTTTPKPLKWLRKIMEGARTVVTTGTTLDNAGNLAPSFLRAVLERYQGTRTGQQEIEGKLLDEAEGALWNRARIELTRMAPGQVPPIARKLIALDPADGAEDGDEMAIAVGGKGTDGRYFVFDCQGHREEPAEWLRRAVLLWHSERADAIVVEKNHGGKWIRATLEQLQVELEPGRMISGRDVPLREVWASEGKRTRAEPISMLYEQGRVSHVARIVPDPLDPMGAGVASWVHLEELEDQQCSWEGIGGEASPDRLDAMVWLLTELSTGGGPARVSNPSRSQLPGVVSR